MQLMAESHPDIQIEPQFMYTGGLEAFLKNESDIHFTLEELTRHIPSIDVHKLFTSRIYLITLRDDPLAEKNLITEEDLYGRDLMVGGGSPVALRAVQQRLISSGKINYFNSPDHDTTLTNVAAGRGVCLAPGFLNDHSGQFAWIPFDCTESFSCVLCTHKNDARENIAYFVKILKDLYREATAFPL
jgi:DNA-binding transcriptional LysR family regulator